MYIEETNWLRKLLGFRARGIYLPLSDLNRLRRYVVRRLGGKPSSLRDVLRHELAHAFAVEHPTLVRRSRAFRTVFGAAYDHEGPVTDYHREQHISPYASTNPAEDFAETFMTYVRKKGRIESFRSRRPLFRKLAFIRKLRGDIRRRRIPLG
jgi:hypothetical protein